MDFYELFDIVVYEAIKINHCTHLYQLIDNVLGFIFLKVTFTEITCFFFFIVVFARTINVTGNVTERQYRLSLVKANSM